MNLDTLKNSIDKDHFLDMLGLETRRGATSYVVPVLTVLGVGMLVGAGIGLLVAPRPGRELRNDLMRRIQNAPHAVATLPQKATDAMHWAADKTGERSHDIVS